MFIWSLLVCFLHVSCCVTSNRTLLQQYLNWAEVYDVDVSGMTAGELKRKLRVFQDNANFISTYNAEHPNEPLKLNRYADFSHQEFRDIYTMDMENITDSDYTENFTELEDVEIDKRWYVPSAIDWRNKYAVTSVKDEGNCRASYAFAAAGAVEGLHAIKTGFLRSISVQELVDCGGRMGCRGGSVNVMFKYIIGNGGVATDSSYGYRGESGSCQRRSSYCSIKSFTKVQKGSEYQLKEAVAKQPVAVMIDGSRRTFQHYSDNSGVYSDPFCATGHPTHAMLIVGYGRKDGKDYWLLKNSWGRNWGYNGYMYLRRNYYNQCGIATYASYPEM